MSGEHDPPRSLKNHKQARLLWQRKTTRNDQLQHKGSRGGQKMQLLPAVMCKHRSKWLRRTPGMIGRACLAQSMPLQLNRTMCIVTPGHVAAVSSARTALRAKQACFFQVSNTGAHMKTGCLHCHTPCDVAQNGRRKVAEM